MDLYDQFPNSFLNFDEDFQPVLRELSTHKITLFDLITTSIEEVYKKISEDISVIQLKLFIDLLRDEICSTFTPKPSWHRIPLSTGFTELDHRLNGGYSGLVEIFGESSTGKSQMCFQFMKVLTCNDEKCVYISTEGGNFQSNRLLEMGANLKYIYFINCHDLESQEHIINYQLPNLLKKDGDIRLVIVDSISHHIRVELNPSRTKYFLDYINSQKYISKLCKTLQQYIEDFNISIVFTNQITSKPAKQIVNSSLKPLCFDYQVGWLTGLSTKETIRLQSNTSEEINIPTIGLNLWNFCNLRICLGKFYRPVTSSEIPERPNIGDHKGERGWTVERFMNICHKENDTAYQCKDSGAHPDRLHYIVTRSGLKSVD